MRWLKHQPGASICRPVGPSSGATPGTAAAKCEVSAAARQPRQRQDGGELVPDTSEKRAFYLRAGSQNGRRPSYSRAEYRRAQPLPSCARGRPRGVDSERSASSAPSRHPAPPNSSSAFLESLATTRAASDAVHYSGHDGTTTRARWSDHIQPNATRGLLASGRSSARY